MGSPDFSTYAPSCVPSYATLKMQFHIDDASALVTKWIQRYENLTGSAWENTATTKLNYRKHHRDVTHMIGLDRLDGLNLEDKLSSAHNLLFLWIMRYMTHVERRVSILNASHNKHRNAEDGQVTSTNIDPPRKTKSNDDLVINRHKGVSVKTREEYDEISMLQNARANENRYLLSQVTEQRFLNRPHTSSSGSTISDVSMTKSAQLSVYIKTLEHGGLKPVNKMRPVHYQHRHSTSRSPTQQLLAYRPFSPDRSSAMKRISTQSFESSFHIAKPNGVRKTQRRRRIRVFHYNNSTLETSFKIRHFRSDPLSAMVVV